MSQVIHQGERGKGRGGGVEGGAYDEQDGPRNLSSRNENDDFIFTLVMPFLLLLDIFKSRVDNLDLLTKKFFSFFFLSKPRLSLIIKLLFP